jgi:preprotein translocase subunit SecA
VPPSAPNVTSAQITYQRFFPRYLRLAGMSGTLLDSRHELRMLYRCRVERVPLAKPSRARWLGERLFARDGDKWQAVIESVRHHVAAGRPVLVGTDSVAASQHLSGQLSAAGIEHQVLNAVQDADEAARVAQAGRSGTVTVATNIAGRGTDIRLDDAARAAGGLHVIAALRNRARRIDRQLTGRSARQGDPGSAESVTSLDDALLARTWPRWVLAGARALAPRGVVPALLATPLLVGAQRAAQFSDFFVRRQLRRTDRAAQQAFGFAGRRE